MNEKPAVFTKHVYAVVSIVGCCFYYWLGIGINRKISATVLVILFTVLIRILAAKFHWKLPKIRLDSEKTD